MNKTFFTKYDDTVASQLLSGNLMTIDFAYTSISLIPNNAPNQYVPSCEANFSFTNQKDALNIDECITLQTPQGWKVFDALTIENEDSDQSLTVTVTDLTINTTIAAITRKTSPRKIRRVDD